MKAVFCLCLLSFFLLGCDNQKVAAGGCCNQTGGGCASGPNVTADNCDGTYHAGGTCRNLPDGGAVCGVLQ